MQYVPPLFQESPALAGRVARHLSHPSLIWVARNTGQADAAAFQMNEEQDVVGYQPTPTQDLHHQEVNPGQHGQMRLNEFLPRGVLAAFRRRRDAMPLQNVSPPKGSLSYRGSITPRILNCFGYFDLTRTNPGIPHVRAPVHAIFRQPLQVAQRGGYALA